MKQIQQILLASVVTLALVCTAQRAWADYVDNGDGTVTDEVSGLVWEKIGSSSNMIWKDALLWCTQTGTGGYSDWRLPNKRELERLTDESHVNPAIDTSYFTETGSIYWTSTTLTSIPGDVFVVDFNTGKTEVLTKGFSSNYVRCVRSGL